ncbi:hypothetical protein HA402_005332 [Bradysia odoriphaga]|nr:hypothetical protein HA402_005332 [Bradysia odoriphaga]
METICLTVSAAALTFRDKPMVLDFDGGVTELDLLFNGYVEIKLISGSSICIIGLVEKKPQAQEPSQIDRPQQHHDEGHSWCVAPNRFVR